MSAVERDVNRIPEVVRELKELCASDVCAGLFADRVPEKVMIAAKVNEFGALIRKTEKMRRFLGAMARKYGIELDSAKGNPTFIRIPARPFIRTAVQRNQQGLFSIAARMLERVFGGAATARDVLAAVGLGMERAIKDQINRVSSPPLHPLTRAMKGSAKPLVRSGVMRNAVTFKIVRRG